MIFREGTSSNIHALADPFHWYSQISSQFVNPQKFSIYGGSISTHRLLQISNLIGFNTGFLPFNYLGEPIFNGKPKTSYFQPLADKVKLKLSAWKASLLSIAGRIQLVKSVIQCMLLHCISVYSWPVHLIKEMEKWMRNFIWSGDVNKRKLVTVAWHKVCFPDKEGGLVLGHSLRSMREPSWSCPGNSCNLIFNGHISSDLEFWKSSLQSNIIFPHQFGVVLSPSILM